MRTTERRGGALLAVLWLSAGLAAIAFTLAGTVRGEVERAATASDGLRSYHLARGAVGRAILHMMWGAQSPAFAHYYTPGMPALRLNFPEGEVLVEIVPEAAKLNINGAPPEELFRLLGNLGADPGRAREIALAIVDWRSPPPPGAAGLFDHYYLSLTPSFRPRHASFEEIEELLMVRGVTPELYYGSWEPSGGEAGAPLVRRGGLAACVSVFGSPTAVDINTARPAVLAAVGVPPDAVAAILQRRAVMPFRTEELPGLAPMAGPAFARLRIGGNSIFTLRATARLRLPGGGLSDMRRGVAAMVKFMPAGYDAPYHILRWYDTAWSF